ncbi:fused response regulator/phosphatase [Mangrovitalea sediminis]|uniref:fused response regulator/phosphatase n=1 Tax=Mangrovitalea sediminis TaxID=1982043 RepID=UPI00117772F6|nr:fused response regulator/phosphatase [Mangrovitalea sediminis]
MGDVLRSGVSVLVVDDDELMCLLVKGALESDVVQDDRGGDLPLNIAIASSKRDIGHWVANREELDLVLLNDQFGGGGALTFLGMFRGKGAMKKAYEPSVVIISSNDDQSFINRCFSEGAADYLIKPFSIGLLVQKAKALLRERWLTRKIDAQNQRLQLLIAESSREEQLARFTYDFLVSRVYKELPGVYAASSSSRAFSGDLILRAKGPVGQAYVMLVDATGHGLSAAITLLPVATTFTTMAAKGFSLQQILFELNKRLLRDTPPDRFVGAIAIEMDVNRSEVRLWNGGMPPLMKVSKTGVIEHQFPSRHMALGILDDRHFDVSVETHALTDEGYWFFYSDGLTEQPNADGEPFSRDRLESALMPDPEDAVNNVFNALFAFAGKEKFHDDISCCSLAPKVFWEASQQTVERSPTGEWSPEIPRSPFVYNVVLSGPQLAKVSMPALCSGVMQQLDLPNEPMAKVMTVVTELVSNAIDHGVLRLDSSLKEQESGFLAYAEERESRVRELTEKDRVSLKMAWNSPEAPGLLLIQVIDSGTGFDMGEEGDDALTRVSGRGLQLLRRLCASLEIRSPGNNIIACVSL